MTEATVAGRREWSASAAALAFVGAARSIPLTAANRVGVISTAGIRRGGKRLGTITSADAVTSISRSPRSQRKHAAGASHFASAQHRGIGSQIAAHQRQRFVDRLGSIRLQFHRWQSGVLSGRQTRIY